MSDPLTLGSWYPYQSVPELTEKLEGFHIWVTALRKFLRKGIETVLVSGHFLHQTEEALGLQSQFPPLHPQADSLDRVHM